MDKSKIILIAACVAFVVALAGAIWLQSKGVTVPAWLAVLLAAGGWVMKSPLSPADKPEASKGGAS